MGVKRQNWGSLRTWEEPVGQKQRELEHSRRPEPGAVLHPSLSQMGGCQPSLRPLTLPPWLSPTSLPLPHQASPIAHLASSSLTTSPNPPPSAAPAHRAPPGSLDLSFHTSAPLQVCASPLSLQHPRARCSANTCEHLVHTVLGTEIPDDEMCLQRMCGNSHEVVHLPHPRAWVGL